jgi:acyl-CoA thioester hydrolase
MTSAAPDDWSGARPVPDEPRIHISPAHIRVRFGDTDASGIVAHAQYLAYFEAGRVEAMRQVGLSYGQLIEAGFHLPVVEARVRYVQPARFDDVLVIAARTTEVRRARLLIEYEIRREVDAQLLTTGSTLHACVTADHLRPTRLPDWAAAALRRLQS